VIHAAANNDPSLSENLDQCDPVDAWLRAHTGLATGEWHSTPFTFDNSLVTVTSRSRQVVDYLRDKISAYYPADAIAASLRPDCHIEIHIVDSRQFGNILLPGFVAPFQESEFELPTPEATVESEEFLHLKWPGIEAFWRPSNLLASLSFSRPRLVRLLVASYLSPEAEADEMPLRVKVRRSPQPLRLLERATTPVMQHVSLADIADLVRVVTIRAFGHYCLHAAAVATGGRAALLMGPSGSGKTTTALALLRGGFDLLNDEFAVLHENLAPVRLTGFERAPQVVGPAPARLADLEQTLRPGCSGKNPIQIERKLDSAGETRWLLPAALLFLQIKPGTTAHLLKPMSPEEAFVRVTNQVLDPTNVFRRNEQAQALIALVESSPAFELSLGNDLASLPDVVRSAMEGRP